MWYMIAAEKGRLALRHPTNGSAFCSSLAIETTIKNKRNVAEEQGCSHGQKVVIQW